MKAMRLLITLFLILLVAGLTGCKVEKDTQIYDTKIIISPEKEVDDQQIDFLAEIIAIRLSIYGVNKHSVQSSVLGDNKYIIVKTADVDKQILIDLVEKQGEFEAKIGDITVFTSGNDIIFVCDNPSCSRISYCDSPQNTIDGVSEEWKCKFEFSIKLSADAAKKFGNVTTNLDIVEKPGEKSYLSSPIVFYLDDIELDSLQIASELKGQEIIDLSISGGGLGVDRSEASDNANKNMKQLITILKTGSLPVKLKVESVEEYEETS